MKKRRDAGRSQAPLLNFQRTSFSCRQRHVSKLMEKCDKQPGLGFADSSTVCFRGRNGCIGWFLPIQRRRSSAGLRGVTSSTGDILQHRNLFRRCPYPLSPFSRPKTQSFICKVRYRKKKLFAASRQTVTWTSIWERL